MRLVANWRQVLRHAWSLHLNILLGLMAALDAATSYLVDGRLSSALIVAAVSLATCGVRLVAQEKISGDPET